MLNCKILFRKELVEPDEFKAAEQFFKVVKYRTSVQENDLVIPRYSALPFYEELAEDVGRMGGRLINSYRQHCYVADLRNWYYDLADFTPRTWFFLDQIPEEGPFVLKGQTNSKKFFWNSHMFANNKKEATEVFLKLAIDGYVGNQQIYCRQYVPLKNFGTGVAGLPFSEEYRFFICNGKILTGNFYWSEVMEENEFEDKKFPSPNNVPTDFLNKIIEIVSPRVPFFVVDIARTEEGKWIVIELNDGQQSGLSGNKPEILYSNLKRVLEGQEPIDSWRE